MTRLVLFELFVTILLLFEHQPKTARFLVSFELFVTNLRLFEHQQQNCSLAENFLDPMV